VRLTPAEFRAELERCFEVLEITGIRNIPGRTVAGVVGRVLGEARGERTLSWMTSTGVKADHRLARTPVAPMVGLFLLATLRRAAADASTS
jgi:hypothetical protein